MSFRRPAPCEQGAADCYPFGCSADPICLTTKVINDLFGLVIGKVVWIISCFYGVVGAICCSRVFEFWSKFVPEIFQHVKKIGPRVPQGRPNSVQGGTPQRFQKRGRPAKGPELESAKELAPKCKPQYESLAYFVSNIFRCFPASFLGCYFNRFFKHLGIMFRIILMIC